MLPAIIVIVIMVLAIMWMIAEPLNLPQLKAWVKLEIRELIIAAILIGIIYSAFFAERTITKVLTGVDGYVGVARGTLNNLLQKHENVFKDIIILSSKMTSLSGYSFNYGVPIGIWASFSFPKPTLTGASAILGPITFAAQAEANAILLYKAMVVFLDFFESTILSVILPLGFVLRVIPFSRQLGNTLIALSLGAIVLYPFSLILISKAHELPGFSLPAADLSDNDVESLEVTIPAPLKQMCEASFARYFIGLNEIGWGLLIAIPVCAGPQFAACFPPLFSAIANFWYPWIVNFGLQITMSNVLLITQAITEISANTIFTITNDFLMDVTNLIVISIIDVLVIAIITIIGTKSISAALGGEAYLIGIQRLV